MVIGVQNYLNAGVQTVQVKDEGYFWVKMFDVQKKLGVKNICDLARKEIMGIVGTSKTSSEDFKKYKRFLQEITNKTMGNSKNKYVCNDIMEKIIKNCRRVKKCKNGKSKDKKEEQRQNFRMRLGFKENDIFLTKEQSVLSKITTVFAKCEIYLQYFVSHYKIDTYFPKYGLAIEIDELGHSDRSNEKEKIRENRIKQKLQYEFIRINPDKEGFVVFVELANIENHIADSTRKNNTIFTKKLLKVIFKLKTLLVVNKIDVDEQLDKEINELDNL